MKYPDPRTVRTKKLLSDALVTLMQKKNVHNISVKELTDVAGINRVTFYHYYTDMPEFLSHTLQDIVDGMMNYINSAEGRNLGGRDGFYSRYFTYIAANETFFRTMLSDNGLPEFRRLLLGTGMDEYIRQIKPHRECLSREVDPDILVQYIISAHVGIVECWLSGGMKYSPDFMAKQLSKLTLDGPLKIAQIAELISLPK